MVNTKLKGKCFYCFTGHLLDNTGKDFHHKMYHNNHAFTENKL